MIFAQYRDTVEEICELLAPHAPHVKAMAFVGQGVGTHVASDSLNQRPYVVSNTHSRTTGRSSAGFTQKEQSRVIEVRDLVPLVVSLLWP
jgi:ERCC4-related helicase